MFLISILLIIPQAGFHLNLQVSQVEGTTIRIHSYLQDLFLVSDFKKNFVTVASGTGIAQILSLALTPVLTRVYTPQDFGVFAVFVALWLILSVAATGRFETTIILPKDDASALGLLKLSLLATLAIWALLTIICFPVIWIWNEWLETHGFSLGLWLLPLSVALSGFIQTFMSWNNRQKCYRTIALINPLERLSILSLSLLFAYLDIVDGLIWAHALGLFIPVAYLVFVFLLRRTSWTSFARVSFRSLIHEYKEFPLKSGWSNMFSIASLQVPVLCIGYTFSPALVGQFGLAFRVMEAPITLLSDSFYLVYFRHASGLDRSRYSALLKKSVLSLFILLVVPLTAVGVFGPTLFAFLFGEGWEYAGLIAALLAPMCFARILFSSQRGLIFVTRQLGFEFKIYMTLLLGQLIMFAIGAFVFQSLTVVTALMSVTATLIYLVALWWCQSLFQGAGHLKIRTLESYTQSD